MGGKPTPQICQLILVPLQNDRCRYFVECSKKSYQDHSRYQIYKITIGVHEEKACPELSMAGFPIELAIPGYLYKLYKFDTVISPHNATGSLGLIGEVILLNNRSTPHHTLSGSCVRSNHAP